MYLNEGIRRGTKTRWLWNIIGMSVVSTRVSLSYPCGRFCSSFSLTQLSVLLFAYFALLSVVHVNEFSLTQRAWSICHSTNCSDICLSLEQKCILQEYMFLSVITLPEEEHNMCNLFVTNRSLMLVEHHTQADNIGCVSKHREPPT